MCITHAFTPTTTITTKKIEHTKKHVHTTKGKNIAASYAKVQVSVYVINKRINAKSVKEKTFVSIIRLELFVNSVEDQPYVFTTKIGDIAKNAKVQHCVFTTDRKHCMVCCPHPIISCDYTLCTFQTKNKYTLKKHKETHMEKFQQ